MSEKQGMNITAGRRHIFVWRFDTCAEPPSMIELGKRNEIKELIKTLRKNNKDIDYNIFKSMSNINLDAILGYHCDEKTYNFLDDYDK